MVNPINIIRLLQQKYPATLHYETPITANEKTFAERISDLIEGGDNYDYEFDEELFGCDERFEEEFTYSEDEEFEAKKTPNREIDDEKWEEVYQYWKGTTTKIHRSNSSMKKSFRWLTDSDLSMGIYRYATKNNFDIGLFRYQARRNRGDITQLAKAIREAVLEKYKQACQMGIVVKERDLQLWGRYANISILGRPLPNFTASRNWLHHFKKANKIVSRKV
jgi:hypothetical protein